MSRIKLFFLISLYSAIFFAQRIENNLSNTSISRLLRFDVHQNENNYSSNSFHLNTDSYKKHTSTVFKPNDSTSTSRKKGNPIRKKKTFLKKVNGYVINSHNFNPISKATLKVFYSSSKKLYSTFSTDENGFFEFEVPTNNQLYIETKHEKYSVRYKKIMYHNTYKTDLFKIYLLPISKEILGKEKKIKSIDLKNIPVKYRNGLPILDTPEIFFGLNEFNLSGAYNYKIIDDVIKILVDNPDLVIKISSHTDSRGDKDYLLDLSEKRSVSIRRYFNRKMIESKRIDIEGHGSSDFLINCNTKVKCTEKQYAKNKRTEFVILNPIK